MNKNNEVAISVTNISKAFKLPHEKQSSIKGMFVSMFHGKRTYERQQVLNNVSFEVKKGEFFGIVGRNGSGKSTLLKLLAEIYSPDAGSISINGKLTPFIELGVGFSPELTGRENVFLNGALLGFQREEMVSMYKDIVEFAELERFMDQKLKNYSSGMQVRLAFSIAIRADSPILLLDEVLAVGDTLFQKKCYEYFKKLRHDKKTVILVSHDTGVLQEYCTQGVLIEGGKIVSEGVIDKVISDYIKILNQDEEVAAAKQGEQSSEHIGSGRALIRSVSIEGTKGSNLITDNDNELIVIAGYHFKEDVVSPIYGITINDAAGERILAVNNMWSKKRMATQKKGDSIVIEWVIPNIFNSGTFYVTPAVAASGGSEVLDQVNDMASFKVSKRQISNAATNVKYTVKVVSK